MVPAFARHGAALLLGATAGVRALPAADQAALMAAAKAAIGEWGES